MWGIVGPFVGCPVVASWPKKAFLQARAGAGARAPDVAALRAQLEGYSPTRDEVQQVLAEVYAPHTVASHARAVSRQTIAHFTAVGAFDDATALDELASYGLLAATPQGSLA